MDAEDIISCLINEGGHARLSSEDAGEEGEEEK
jgi:hypothetical protein